MPSKFFYTLKKNDFLMKMAKNIVFSQILAFFDSTSKSPGLIGLKYLCTRYLIQFNMIFKNIDFRIFRNHFHEKSCNEILIRTRRLEYILKSAKLAKYS